MDVDGCYPTSLVLDYDATTACASPCIRLCLSYAISGDLVDLHEVLLPKTTYTTTKHEASRSHSARYVDEWHPSEICGGLQVVSTRVVS